MPITLLKLPEVLKRQGVGLTTFYASIKRGTMTPPVKQTARSSAWPADEVDAVTAATIAGQTEAQKRALVRKLMSERKRLLPERLQAIARKPDAQLIP